VLERTIVEVTIDVAGILTALLSLVVALAALRRVNRQEARYEGLRRALRASTELAIRQKARK